MNLDSDEREAILKLSPEEARSTLLSDLSEDEFLTSLNVDELEKLSELVSAADATS